MDAQNLPLEYEHIYKYFINCPTPCSFCESFCYFHVLDHGLVLCLQCRQQSLLLAIIFQTTDQLIKMSFGAEVQSLITAFPN